MTTITRVFVPNRGEIAVRIVRACRALGLEAVVGASEPDRDGLAARMADRVICIGPAPATESYLRPDVIVHAALGTGCDAIHPGYGFLSESPALADLAREHGLRFVGPPAEAMRLAGDKPRARAAAAAAGLPIVPGTELATTEDAKAFAAEAGYPVLLKAAGGGGGRGIKRVRDASELDELFGLAVAEAGAAFGDDRVYVERFLPEARHVEVQVAADEHGAVIHLGERDCSVQRRYQKVVEEAPAPNLPEATRTALAEAAVTFTGAIAYRNVGTVEFLLDTATGAFFFTEMNCRIQVEHPVTEAVTGVDLVAAQLRIADGQPLDIAQTDVRVDGHAIECRLTAEGTGTFTRFTVPDVAGLRVDTHCEVGAHVPPYYDALLAKLIGHAPDRDAAIAVVRTALDGLQVEGVTTNRALLDEVLADADFAAGRVTTRWLEEAIAA